MPDPGSLPRLIRLLKELHMTMQARLHAYREAFNARDVTATLALFADRAIFDMPLLGQRLIGRREISAGLQRIFAVTESALIQVSATKQSPTLIIAEGGLRARLHRDAHASNLPLALVVESRDALIDRLSLYLDARTHRLWADGPLFAILEPLVHQE
jgi:hypothetical protein